MQFKRNVSSKEAGPILPVANFSSDVTEGYAPLFVQFNDSSENATEWKWDFGDCKYSTNKALYIHTVKLGSIPSA